MKALTRRLWQSRWLPPTLVGLVVVALLGGPQALAQITSRPTYTGCLNTTTGSITDVKKGGAALSPCTTPNKKITLSGGDITSVNAGAGLIGGATSGDATLSVDPTWLSQNATTGVSPGTGLVGGSSSGPASLSLDPRYQLPLGCDALGTPVFLGTVWGCGQPISSYLKSFSFGSIANGSSSSVTLGTMTLTLACNTSTNVALMSISDGTTGVSGNYNTFFGDYSDSSAHDGGASIAADGSHAVGATNGSTGMLVYTDSNGAVITANFTWYVNASSCEFHGDLEDAPSS